MPFGEASNGRGAWLCFGHSENYSFMGLFCFFFDIEGTSNRFCIFLENAFSVSWFHIYAMLWNG